MDTEKGQLDYGNKPKKQTLSSYIKILERVLEDPRINEAKAYNRKQPIDQKYIKALEYSAKQALVLFGKEHPDLLADPVPQTLQDILIRFKNVKSGIKPKQKSKKRRKRKRTLMLTEKQKMVSDLIIIDHKSIKEIAEITGTSENNVRKHAKKAEVKIKAMLSAHSINYSKVQGYPTGQRAEPLIEKTDPQPNFKL